MDEGSSVSSKHSSSGTSRSKGSSGKPRPCTVWRKENNKTSVLVCCTFNGMDPRDPSILPTVKKDYLLSTLLLITSTDPTRVPPCFQSANLRKFKSGTYIVLIEFNLPPNKRELTLCDDGPFNTAQMMYIHNLLTDLKVRKVQEDAAAHAKKLMALDMNQPRNVPSPHQNDQSKKKDGSQGSSSIGGFRSCPVEFVDKNVFIKDWLKNGKKKILRKQILIDISYSK